MGVVAVFGPPYSGAISRHIDCVAGRLEVPHMVVTSAAERPTTSSSSLPAVEQQLFTINLHPDRRVLGKVYVDLVRMFGWSTFGVVYSQPRGMAHVTSAVHF